MVARNHPAPDSHSSLTAMTTNDDDRTLAARFQAGDEAAFRALYERHGPMLYAMATRLAGAAESDDVLQEVWLRAARKLPAFRWESTLRTWLCGIVVNAARERRRKRHETEELLDPNDESLVAGWNDATLPVIDLERAVARLSPRYREILLLHDVEEYTHAEIGAMLGIDAGTSKSNLSRARALLRRALTPEGSPS
jgi:RNA polymerase sigma-70 factor (ECF subfamily)